MKPWIKAAAVSVSVLQLAQPLFADPGALATVEDQVSQVAAQPQTGLNTLFDGNANSADVPAVVTVPSAPPATRQDLRQAMLDYLTSVQGMFQAQYGPLAYKQANGWSLNDQIEKAKDEVKDSPSLTVAQYQGILRDFFNSTRDYHVSVRFDDTEASSLPFTVVGSNGRYFIEWIDRDKLPASAFPFKVGDELDAIGGQKTSAVIAELRKNLGNNAALTDQALAALLLTSRKAASYGDVQQGPVAVTVTPKGSKTPQTRELTWDYTPEMVSEPVVQTLVAPNAFAGTPSALPMPWMTNMLSPVEQAVDSQDQAGSPFGLGDRNGYLPALGKRTWGAPKDAIFSAYVYKLADGRSIGYVRIPSYDPDDTDKAAQEFAGLVQRFEGSTDGLVIDQVNNPGGSVLYLYALASMLTDRPLTAPKHHVKITQDDVDDAAKFIQQAAALGVASTADAQTVLGKTQEGYPVDYEFYQNLLSYSRFVVNQWNQGKRQTDPTFLEGVDMINPSPTARYTKPILLLINELDFSGGDFFPAIMQDNARATLFGTRTAGAGGFVRDVTFPNQVGVSEFTMTGSIAERADKEPIENLGVTADIQYAPTPFDMQNGFKGYAAAVNTAMARLLGPAPAR